MSESISENIAISCQNLVKTYLVYDNLFKGMLHGIIHSNENNPHVRKVQALKDINIDINKGEVFGILGANGAGKSTLLACIAGITPIDGGNIHINGSVEALLKIGVGFHPWFTGRENIIVGMISMGATVEEAKEAVEPILEFAELTEFGDMPFYTYSSGMMSRLQFSVATHRIPEILILDEALSAGDGYFNSKANRRIEDICESGSTILMVTHSVTSVESLCHRAIIIDKGRIIEKGNAAVVGDKYRKIISETNAENYKRKQILTKDETDKDSGTGEVRIIDHEIVYPDGYNFAVWEKPLKLIVNLDVNIPIKNPRCRIDIYCAHYGTLATCFTNYCVDPETSKPRTVSLGELTGRCKIIFDIPALPLGGYTYFWSFSLMPNSKRRKLEGVEDFYVHRRVMGYFQVESFPDEPGMILRNMITETPVNIVVSAS